MGVIHKRMRRWLPGALAGSAVVIVLMQTAGVPHTQWVGHPLMTALLIALLALSLNHARRTDRSAGHARAVLAQTEERLRQAQKMEAVGRLAGAIAHDFNNLLTVLSGYTDLVLQGLAQEHPSRCDVLEIQKACARAAGITTQLLSFSRKQPLSMHVLDLNRSITDMSEILRRLVGVNTQTTLRLDDNIGAIKADRVQIEQILMNLAVNARDAMVERGGNLSIETDAVELDADIASHFVGLQPGRYVLLTVSDNGCGMDEDTRARIFEPFFTTKPAGKGTGLGLATVYGNVHQSGGSISVDSRPGAGTTFHIYLPVVDEAPRGETPRAVPSGSLLGNETVLLVEDNEQVRTMARQVLCDRGYSVIVAADGEEGLRVANAHPAIDLLLSDVSMPKLTGTELARRLRSEQPTLPVLLMSGFPDFELPTDLGGGIELIEKPFTPQFLAGKVRAALDAE